MSDGVVVLGMHRSGTSAVTRVVNLLGVPINTLSDWLPAEADNPRGFWESAALLDINNRLLAACGGTSTCPPRVDPQWEYDARVEPLVELAAESFRAVYPSRQWVWKDPRTCLTLPFWRRVLDTKLAVILVYRNPLEVARSLGARDRLSKTHCLALWECYVRASLRNAERVPLLITRYEDILANSTAACEQLHRFLADNDLTVDEGRVSTAAAFLDGDLRHHRLSAADVTTDPDLLDTQAQLFTTLDGLRGVHPEFACPRLPGESAWVSDLFERVRADDRTMLQQRAMHEAHQTSIDWLERQRQRWQCAAEEREQAVQELQSWIRAVEHGKRWLERQSAHWEQVASERQHAIAELQAWLRQVEEGKQWLEQERLSWKQLAEERGESIQGLQTWLRSVETGNEWLEQQRGRWERTAQKQGKLMAELRSRLNMAGDPHYELRPSHAIAQD